MSVIPNSPPPVGSEQKPRYALRQVVLGNVGVPGEQIRFCRLECETHLTESIIVPAGWWVSDAVLAARRGTGRTIYHLAIVLPDEKLFREGISRGDLTIWPDELPGWRASDTRIVGWAFRPEFGLGYWPPDGWYRAATCHPKNNHPDLASAQRSGDDQLAQRSGDDQLAQRSGDDQLAQRSGDDQLAQRSGDEQLAQRSGDDQLAQPAPTRSANHNVLAPAFAMGSSAPIPTIPRAGGATAEQTSSDQRPLISSVLVDVDSTLYPMSRQFIRYLRQLHGIEITEAQIDSWDFMKPLGLTGAQIGALINDYCLSHEEILAAVPYPGATEAVNRWLDAGVAVHIVTDRLPRTEDPTRRWVKNIGLDRADVFVQPGIDKLEHARSHALELIVDDRPSLLEAAAEAGIPIATLIHAYNRQTIEAYPQIIAAPDWEQLVAVLETRFRFGPASDSRQTRNKGPLGSWTDSQLKAGMVIGRRNERGPSGAAVKTSGEGGSRKGQAAPLPLILFGRPGAGKGSLAQLLVGQGAFTHCSTGQAMRAWAQGPRPEQRELKEMLARGEFGSDELAAQIVSEFLAAQPEEINAVILDGFPRTMGQFETWLRQADDPGLAISLELGEATARRRLGHRMQCPNDGWTGRAGDAACPRCGAELVGRPEDADEVAVEKRMRYHAERVEPIITAWVARGLPLLALDARLPTTELATRVVRSAVAAAA